MDEGNSKVFLEQGHIPLNASLYERLLVIQVFTDYLPRAQHCYLVLPCFLLFNPITAFHSQIRKQIWRGENDLPKVVQLLCREAIVQVQLPHLLYLPHGWLEVGYHSNCSFWKLKGDVGLEVQLSHYFSESWEGQSHSIFPESSGQCHTTEWTNILCKLQSRETLIFKGQWLIHLGIDCILYQVIFFNILLHFYRTHFVQYFIAQTQVKAKEFKTCKIIHPSRVSTP